MHQDGMFFFRRVASAKKDRSVHFWPGAALRAPLHSGVSVSLGVALPVAAVLPNSVPKFVRHTSVACKENAISMQAPSLAATRCHRVNCEHVANEVYVLCIGAARAAFGATLRSKKVSRSFRVKVCKVRYISAMEHDLSALVKVPSEQSGPTVPLCGCQVLWVCVAKNFMLGGHGTDLQNVSPGAMSSATFFEELAREMQCMANESPYSNVCVLSWLFS